MPVKGTLIKELRKNKKLTQMQLADALGVSKTSVASWETGLFSPEGENLDKLVHFFNVSADYLLGNTASSAPADAPKNKVDPGMSFKNIVPPRNMIMIPVISPEIRPSAGRGNDYGYSDLEWNVIDTIPLADGEIAAFYSADNLLSMYVDGNSMEPQIHDGDLVVFNLTHEWVSGNIMVVCLDGRLLVKGLIYDGEDKPPILRSTNKEYPDIHINENSFFVVYGRVLRIVRMSKPKPVI